MCMVCASDLEPEFLEWFQFCELCIVIRSFTIRMTTIKIEIFNFYVVESTKFIANSQCRPMFWITE